jgi:predicted AlkP superfamily pyrophosphatase or phosphodiesterase
MNKLFLCAFSLIFFALGNFGQAPIRDIKPTVILISLDGFRYDYPDKIKPPTIRKLIKNGVRARWMIPSFPTKTFPNHYTVATGLYPEHHGIIENNIYDFGVVFTLSKREEVQNPRWWGGEPIWVTAVKQGQKAGAFFFPGTEAPIQNVRPTYWKDYDGKIPNTERIDQILSWLDLPQAARPTVFTLYFSDTDDAGHHFGPDSEQLKTAVRKVDGDLKRLVDGLEKRRVGKKVNIIITSDHGMATVKAENSIVLDELFDFARTERILWTGEIVQIFPKAGAEAEILEKLKAIRRASCWKKSEIPARLHYQASPRIAPIVCSAEAGWYLTSRARLAEREKQPDRSSVWGAHGYDNQIEAMRATFIAHGPAFRRGYVHEPFENVNVYNLMCRILGLTPAPNDGNFELVKKMLKNP